MTQPGLGGVTLKELRERAGLCQRGAANLVGVTERMWRYWETGDFTPGLSRLGLIARILNVELMTIAQAFAENEALTAKEVS